MSDFDCDRCEDEGEILMLNEYVPCPCQDERSEGEVDGDEGKRSKGENAIIRYENTAWSGKLISFDDSQGGEHEMEVYPGEEIYYDPKEDSLNHEDGKSLSMSGEEDDPIETFDDVPWLERVSED